jgi:hypothetical protein
MTLHSSTVLANPGVRAELVGKFDDITGLAKIPTPAKSQSVA